MRRIAIGALAAFMLSCAPLRAQRCLPAQDRAQLQARFDAITVAMNASNTPAADDVVAEFYGLSEQLTDDNRCRLAANDAAFFEAAVELEAETLRGQFTRCERRWRRTHWWTKLQKYHGHDPCRAALLSH